MMRLLCTTLYDAMTRGTGAPVEGRRQPQDPDQDKENLKSEVLNSESVIVKSEFEEHM